jgi:hypothetical protein
MKKVFLAIICIIALTLGTNAQQKFGGAVDKSTVYNPDEIPVLLKGKEVVNLTVKGEVKEVCQAKGCWMTLNVAGEKMTVKFKDYAFFMPKDISGKQVTFTGKVTKQTISVAEQKHLAQDAGKTKKEIKKIKKPKEAYGFEASGVEIEG